MILYYYHHTGQNDKLAVEKTVEDTFRSPSVYDLRTTISSLVLAMMALYCFESCAVAQHQRSEVLFVGFHTGVLPWLANRK